jgi:hypothetical protein
MYQIRDDAIKIIEGLGGDCLARKLWKKLTVIELQLKGFILNMMTNIGMPAGYMI